MYWGLMMTNKGVKGIVKDEMLVGISGLIVAAYDAEALTNDVLLSNKDTFGPPLYGRVMTKNDGRFDIIYSKWSYGLEANPDIRLRIFDSVNRLIFESQIYEDVKDEMFVIPDIKISRNNAEGWLVTQGGSEIKDHSPDNEVDFIIDNEQFFIKLINAVKNAQRSISIMQLDFALPDDIKSDKPKLITIFDNGMPQENKETTGTRLEKELIFASNRGINVRLLMHNAYAINAESKIKYFTYYNNTLNNKIEIKKFEALDEAPLHAKAAIIDSDAFIIGSPFLQEYFDSYNTKISDNIECHRIDEPRRDTVNVNVLGIITNYAVGVPIHDCSLHIRGPAVESVNNLFTLHWNESDLKKSLKFIGLGNDAQEKKIGVQIVHSLTGEDRFKEIPHGETGVLESYLRAINNAKDYIYLENQYFVSEDIANALISAIRTKVNLNIIILLNISVDIPSYNSSQCHLLHRLFMSLKPDERKRIGIFTLWTHESVGLSKPRIIRNYVHSKVGIVDDKWATIGTANLDNASLSSSDFGLFLDKAARKTTFDIIFGPDRYKERRASEINASLFDGIEGHPSTGVVSKIRRMLWSEHLGFRNTNTGDLDSDNELLLDHHGEGWLKIWNQRVKDKVDGLKADPKKVSLIRVLPYPLNSEGIPFISNIRTIDDPVETKYEFLSVSRPIDYLKMLNIDVSKIKVEVNVRSFSFEKGIWD